MVMVTLTTLFRPTTVCPFCQEERFAETVVRGVQGRRERGRGGVMFAVMVGEKGRDGERLGEFNLWEG